jgi:hypothetical protein
MSSCTFHCTELMSRQKFSEKIFYEFLWENFSILFTALSGGKIHCCRSYSSLEREWIICGVQKVLFVFFHIFIKPWRYIPVQLFRAHWILQRRVVSGFPISYLAVRISVYLIVLTMCNELIYLFGLIIMLLPSADILSRLGLFISRWKYNIPTICFFVPVIEDDLLRYVLLLKFKYEMSFGT